MHTQLNRFKHLSTWSWEIGNEGDFRGSSYWHNTADQQPTHPRCAQSLHNSGFNIPHETMKNVSLLGSFAKRVTLYSQQVRALNLVYALHKTNKFRTVSKVVVVGAGAAGLMAAAAAAHLGASVTLLEQLQGPMELQRSSRIRWIDPFIYDWPVTESAGTRANLPFLDWEAACAEKVSEQIEEKWKAFVDSPPTRFVPRPRLNRHILCVERRNETNPTSAIRGF